MSNRSKTLYHKAVQLLVLSIVLLTNAWAQPAVTFTDRADEMVREAMKKGNIPGLSLVIIQGGQETIHTYGVKNLATKAPVTAHTLFEIGSCSKAFTALAITLLEAQNKISLDDYITHYLPWFSATYQDSTVNITLRQLLHHTSGIPWSSIANIPADTSKQALERTVRTLVGSKLKELPGLQYEYATINYDVLALVVQQVTGQRFEVYLQQNVMNQLNLNSTTIGQPAQARLMATGYKNCLLRPQPYHAPRFNGNNAAGYVISNANDMARWLKLQLGNTKHYFYELAQKTHTRDRSVPLHGVDSYARGWNVSLDGTGIIYHTGLNPNFSSYVAFQPEKGIGLAILTNSNSPYTNYLGARVMHMMLGKKQAPAYDPGNNNDGAFTGLSVGLILYIAIVLGLIGNTVHRIIKRKRVWKTPGKKEVGLFTGAVLTIVPVLAALYYFPYAMLGFNWFALKVWSPFTLQILVGLLLLSFAVSYLSYLLSLCFPEPNKYLRKAPQLILMSVLSGLANVVVIIMVTSMVGSDVNVYHQAFYYTLAIAIYLLGRRFVQVNLIRFARGLVYELRVMILNKIFSTRYQKFETMNRGWVLTALNDDVETIGQSTNILISLVTSLITAVGAFIYLSSLAFWASLLTFATITALALIYYLVGRTTNKFFNQARDSRDIFMSLITGLVDGFKELSLKKAKKDAYQGAVLKSAKLYKDRISKADLRFANAFLVGESLLVVLLGFVSIALTLLFPGIQLYMIMSFVVVLLYLVGPINAILGAVPGILRVKIAWQRVQQFLKEIPASTQKEVFRPALHQPVRQYQLDQIEFKFPPSVYSDDFTLGPISLNLNASEILFIVGGNGSGKTTLAKLICGLYKPTSGQIRINGNPVNGAQLSEHFSMIFNPPYMFQELFGISTDGKENEIEALLSRLELDKKVGIKEGRFTTLKLSTGQRKRLSLLQSYLEEAPILLFDEWAADQDPQYRHFFYRTLLPELRDAGKIIIVISHDDHYFDIANKILKLDHGQAKWYNQATEWLPSMTHA